MHNRHAWTTQDDDGVKRQIRVVKTMGAWRFQARRTGEEVWKYYDEPPESDLAAFRDILFRKYQCKRASWEDVQWADRELGKLRRGTVTGER
jgi:hypothetical protein